MSTTPNIELIMNTTVGIEVEMTGITREAAARVAGTVFPSSRVWHKGGYYDKWTCTDNRGRDWDFVYDSSIQSPGSNRLTKCELNTPPLTYAEDMEKLQKLIRALRNAGAKSGTQYGCGIHIHVSGKGHNAKTLRNFIHLMYSNDELVRKSLGVTSERQGWCQPIDERLVEADTAEEAVSTVECCFNTAKEYHIISVKEITSKGDTIMARKSNKKLYVAYGSNLHLGQMAYRCPEAKVYGAGVLKNYELTFWGNWGRNGVATVLPKSGTDIPVGVWEISTADEKNLDVYEGWPRLYRKENIEVTMEDGSVVTAMIYIMNENGMRDTYPSDSYFNTIATGYKSFGFDLGFLEAARDRIAVPNYCFKKF